MNTLSFQFKNASLTPLSSTSPSYTPDSDFNLSTPLDMEEFERQKILHSELLYNGTGMSSKIITKPPDIALECEKIEEQIREHQAVTKELKDRRTALEPELFKELQELPNQSVHTDHMTFSIRNRKKRSKMNTEHIVRHLASYAAHHEWYPKDEPRRSEFLQLFADIKWITEERKKDPSNAVLRSQYLELLSKRKEMYMFLGMDEMNYAKMSREETIEPCLSRRVKRRRIQ